MVGTESVDESLQRLVKLGVLKTTGSEDTRKYSIPAPEEVGPKDFLILGSWKKVNVSRKGNRSVRVRTRLMAVRNGVAMRPCGSMIWSDKVTAPKYRLGPAKRMDPLSEKHSTRLVFETAKKQKNDMIFRLNFEPTLRPGEMVDYGFYIWTGNYYSMTRKESMERYNDEWTREGMSVNDPSLLLQIKVSLPDGFHYREAIVEKNPVLTRDGPNVPGATVSKFPPGQRILFKEIVDPDTGHYFVSWKPPE